MEEKKLTDEEIVKALENCKNLKGCCFCTLWGEARKGNHCRDLAIDLIHRLQDENKRLKIQVTQGLRDMKLEVGIRDKEIERLNGCVMSEEQVRKCCADIIQETMNKAAIKCLTDIEDCINGMLDGERYMTKNEVEYLLEHILNKKQEYGVEVE